MGDHTVAGGRDPWQFFFADGTRGERDDPLGASYSVDYDIFGRPNRYTDELGRQTLVTSDGKGRALSYTYPEGDQEQLTYDVRNNPLSLTRIPKPGSTEATNGDTIVVSQSYYDGPTLADCSNIFVCNKPTTVLTPNGQSSLYTWSTTNGTLTQAKLPPDASNHRPTTNYYYTSFGADGFKLLTKKTQYTAPGVTVDTTYGYNASNYFAPQTATVDPTGLNLITTFGYDTAGNQTMVEGPRTDVSDVSYFTYDNNRRRLFSIGADPDGAGSAPRVATFTTYDPVGRVTEVDRGTTTVITGSDFAMSNWVQDKYDPVGNKILETTGDSSGSTRNTAVQFSYDADNRVLCTARRMNPAIFATVGSLNPCSLGTSGSYGSDRITKAIYDAGGQLRQELRAVGTSFAQVYATHKYEPNGKEIAIADADAGVQIGVNYADALNELAAAAHQTNYAYDGFDRLIKTTYADNTTDLILSYDDDGNVLSRHNRANQAFTYSYDALDRMKVKNAAGSTNDVYYTYDLLNHPLTEHFVSATGAGLDNCYDQAGRLTATTASTASTTVPCDGTVFNTATAHTLSYQYDQAGNKARLTWPDGYYVNYSYDALNHMHDAIDSGGTHLATYGYDQLARRTVVQYPNTNDKALYAWSADGDDLNTLSHYFTTAASNVSLNNTFTPAHQWASGNISAAAYRYVETASGSDVYAAANGLNELTTVTPAGGSAATIGYDAKGNLTGDGTFIYTYDTENRLLTAVERKFRVRVGTRDQLCL